MVISARRYLGFIKRILAFARCAGLGNAHVHNLLDTFAPSDPDHQLFSSYSRQLLGSQTYPDFTSCKA